MPEVRADSGPSIAQIFRVPGASIFGFGAWPAQPVPFLALLPATNRAPRDAHGLVRVIVTDRSGRSTDRALLRSLRKR